MIDNPATQSATVNVGDVVRLQLPWSEVNMHMRVAGRVMSVRVLDHGMADILREDGSLYCGAITQSEAGIQRRVRDGALRADVVDPSVRTDVRALRVPTAPHADYPHAPGTLYDCGACEAMPDNDLDSD